MDLSQKYSPREAAIRDYDAHFIDRWTNAFKEFSAVGDEDRVWVIGPTSYLFSIVGQRIAVDPQIRRATDFERLLPLLEEDFSTITDVFITHQHDDHMCLPLIRALKDTDIKWHLPFGCRADLVERSGLKPENIVWARDGDDIFIGDLRVRVFDSPHVPAGGDSMSLPQCGYELIAPNGRVLMPADVRNYDYSSYPNFGNVDLCLTHLWAGNDTVSPEKYRPMLERFADYYARIGASRYILCHLYDIGRKEEHMWHDGHAEEAKSLFAARRPESRVEIAHIGSSYRLF